MRKILVSVIIVLITFWSNSQESYFLATIEDRNAIKELSEVYPEISIEIAFPSSKQELFKSVYRITTSVEQSDLVLATLSNNKAIKNIEEEEAIQTLQTPNDYHLAFGNDYALNLINANDAWEITTGDTNVVIGISDSNYDLNHEELVGAYSTSVNNFSHSNINHGTAVAITASGNTNNGLGKSSIGYNTKMMLGIMSFNSLLNLSNAGVKVLNASWASGCSYSNYHQLIINEIYENGTIIVAAAGNGSTCYGPESLVYPAAYEHVISVSSIGPNDNHERIPGDVHSTHQHNDSVDIVAPGYDVAIGIANNNYTTGNGSSFAAPYVSGTIALMLSVNPCLTYEDVLAILSETAVDVYSLNPIYTGLLGAGRLDAAAAVEMAENYASFSFEMSSEYDCVNDQYLLTIDPEETDYDVSIEWDNGSTDWTLYDQIEGQYDFTIKRAFGCDIDTFVYYVPNQPIYDYTNSVELNYSHTTLHDFNGDGVIRIKGLLIVESGVTYNLTNKKIEFGENNNLASDFGSQKSGIVVKPGGKLTIDNCEFNAVENCNDEWNGIELWGSFKDTIIGTNNLHLTKNTNNSITELTVLNTTLSNATVGIRNHRSNHVFGTIAHQKEECGFVTVINTEFKNNKVGIHLNEHHNNPLSHLISHTDFIAGNQVNATHVKLKGINNIEIVASRFEGNTSEHLFERGVGIIAENSSVNTTKAYAQIVQNTKNTYKDLYEGIHLTSENQKACLFIGNDLFSNVHEGVYVSGNIHTVLDRTTFDMSSETSTENSFALMASNTNQMKITNNKVNGITNTNSTYGFVIKDSYESSVKIIGNDFTGELKTALHFEGVNHNVDFSCNSFDITGEYDLAIAEGSVILENVQTFNTFSSCGNIIANIVNDQNNDTFTYNTITNSVPNCISSGVSITSSEAPANWKPSCEERFNIARFDPNSPDDYENINYEKEVPNILNINYSIASLTSPDSDLKSDMTIYPNPTRDQFTVKAGDASFVKEIIIYDQMGKKVRSYMLTSETESYTINDLKEGAYTVVTYNLNNKVQRGKVIIL